ncbi:small GTP-binding protein [Hortaea werneckii]|nr:small GTP-binding protein [Hortaea werneckii]
MSLPLWSPVTNLCYLVFDNLLVRHIALVADKQLVHTLGRVAVNLLQPLLHVVEAVHVGDIVDDADAVGTAVVGRGDRPESFLAGSVPLCSPISAYVICISVFTVSYNLQLYCLAIELDRPDFEVHTNGRNVALGIGVVGEPQQQAGLSDARVTDEEELEEVVVSARFRSWLLGRHAAVWCGGGGGGRGGTLKSSMLVSERQYVVRPITSPIGLLEFADQQRRFECVLQVTSRLGSRISLRRPQALASRQESQSPNSLLLIHVTDFIAESPYFGDSNDRPPLEFK